MKGLPEEEDAPVVKATPQQQSQPNKENQRPEPEKRQQLHRPEPRRADELQKVKLPRDADSLSTLPTAAPHTAPVVATTNVTEAPPIGPVPVSKVISPSRKISPASSGNASKMDDVLEGGEPSPKSPISPLRGSKALEKLVRQQMCQDSSEPEKSMKQHTYAIPTRPQCGDDSEGYKSTTKDSVGFPGQFKPIVTPYTGASDRDWGRRGLSDVGLASTNSSAQELGQYFDRIPADSGRPSSVDRLSEPGSPDKYNGGCDSVVPRSASMDTLTGTPQPGGLLKKDCPYTTVESGRRSMDNIMALGSQRGGEVERDAHIRHVPSTSGDQAKHQGGVDTYSRRPPDVSRTTQKHGGGADPSVYYRNSNPPAIRTPMVTSRTNNISESRSQIAATNNSGISHKQDCQWGAGCTGRMSELEETVLSLRRQLTDRELQLKETRDTHQKPAAATASENDQRCDTLIREKENLATEVWRLKKEMEELRNKPLAPASTPRPTETHDGSFEDYDPDNPKVLKRKLQDLQCHIQDLQEAHESTISQLSRREHEMVSMREQNSELKRSSASGTLQELRDENKRLNEQHRQVGYMSTHAPSGAGTHLTQELQQLRADLRTLRDRNHQLVQDNIKLAEHLKDLERGTQQPALTEFRHPQYSSSDRNANYRHPEPDQAPGRVPSNEEDADFMRDRMRITNEFRQLVSPVSKYNDREEFAASDRQRRLSNTSDSTVVLMSAKPSGDGLQSAESDEEFRQLDHIADTSGRENYESQRSQTWQTPPRFSHQQRQKQGVVGDQKVQQQDFAKTRAVAARETTNSPNKVASYYPASSNTGGRYHVVTDAESDKEYTLKSPPRLPNGAYGHNVPDKVPVEDVIDDIEIPAKWGRCRAEIKPNMYRPDSSMDGSESLKGSLNITTAQSPVTPDRQQLYSPNTRLGHNGFHDSAQHPCSNNSSILDDLYDEPFEGTHEKGMAYDDIAAARGAGERVGQWVGAGQFARRDSVSSDCTDAILEQADREVQRSTVQPGSAPDRAGVGLRDTPPDSPVRRRSQSNLRSISPKAIITQHNKHLLAPHNDESTLTKGKRPFAPRSPADVNLGNVVKFCRHGGKISKGVIMYVGNLPGKNDTYLGLELEHELGKHDGVYEGQRCFQSKPNRGVFVAFSKVVMAWGDQ